MKQFLFCDGGVITVSLRSIHLSSRRGLAQWHIGRNEMLDLQCMSFTGKGTDQIVVAGLQQQMYRIDVEFGNIVEALISPVGFTHMRRATQCICAASRDGSIHLLDPRTLAITHSWKAYAGMVNDMDARGDYLLTCGWAQQQYQALGLERLVRVYDLKNQRPAAPIAFQSGAAFVRMHPKLSSTCIVISQSGAMQSIDVQNPDMPILNFAQMFEAQVTGLELMPSGKGFAMADSLCQMLLWGSPSKTQFTEFSKQTEFAETQAPTKHLDWSPDVPLNLIGMPYYREALLSGWPNSLVHEVGAPPTKIEMAGLTPMRNPDHGFVGPHSRKTRRYQTTDTRSFQRAQDALVAPRFKSEKPRDQDGDHEPERRLSEDAGKSLNGLTLNSNLLSDPLFYYRPPEIKYSKFGIDDFDFNYFNKTIYSGLETHIVNSYANPLLQIYRFTNTARNLALHHTSQDCKYDNCMLCELGFLVDMLEKASGRNCQATNFLKALSKQPGAGALAVLEDQTFNTPLTTMMQNLNRVLLHRIEDSCRKVAGDCREMTLVFGMTGTASSICTHCHYEDNREQSWYSHDLTYPPKPTRQSPRTMRDYFSRILKDSVQRIDAQRGWCMRCQGFKALSSRRRIKSLPLVLMVNAAIHSAEARQMWSVPDFLPQQIGIIIQNEVLHCYEGQDLQFHLQRGAHDITVYDLVGVVAEVAAAEAQKAHLVSIVDVAMTDSDPRRKEDWHLLNDFLVRPVASDEALSFDARWKLPSVITYQARSMSHVIDNSWRALINTDVLSRSVTQPALSPAYQFKALSIAEPLPGSDSHCAIDAEFVRLLREEINMEADGSRTITRPARSGLARVSVLRGDGPQEELPFIDDYIATDEPVDDYLTQFSGLQPGDLTLGLSRFTLVNLKEVYKKLWVLLNLGCKFVGHGLSSDFRIINMHVPESQVIDTQDLFSLVRFKSQRKLSLRFLAWAVLHEDIQQNLLAGHDSIEDARTALKLWRKYLDVKAAGKFDKLMEDVWLTGKAMEFRVPVERDGRRLPETPVGSTPGTPVRQPASVARTSTPSRLEYGSPLRGVNGSSSQAA